MRFIALIAVILQFGAGLGQTPFGMDLDAYRMRKSIAGPEKAMATEQVYLWQTEYQGASSDHSEWIDTADVLYDTAADLQYGNVHIGNPTSARYYGGYLEGFSDPEANFPRAGQARFPLYWFDIEALRGKTIIEANLCLFTSATYDFGPTEGLVVIMNTVASDAAWLSGSSAGADVHRANDPCWSYMSLAEGSTGWTPSLTSRTLWSDYGEVEALQYVDHDWPNSGFHEVTLDVSTSLQAWADDPSMAFNGFMVTGSKIWATTNFWGGISSTTAMQPFLKVTAR